MERKTSTSLVVTFNSV